MTGNWWQRISYERGLRRQLLILFAVAALILALGLAAAGSWGSTERARMLMLEQGTQLAANLASHAGLPLLYGSADSLESPVTAALAFPDVRRVVVFDLKRRKVLDRGELQYKPFPRAVEQTLAGQPLQPSTVDGLDDGWYFIAPVFSGIGEGIPEFAMVPPEPELIGHAYVHIGRQGLSDMRVAVFIRNALVGLATVLLLLLVADRAINRMTRPLRLLSDMMTQASRAGGRGLRASTEGPSEVARIGRIFNQMMEALEVRDAALRRQNDALESEVALRTREAIYARDAAMQASRHKTEFVANITHELRTPLQAIIGYADLLSEGLADEGMDDLQPDVERINKSAQHLLKLINDVLDLSKIESGRTEMREDEVSLRDVLREAGDTIRPLAEKNGNRLELRVEGDADSVVIDRSRLLQILLNLMSNAAKFTENGEVEVVAQRFPDLLRINVRDTGIGMTAEEQVLAFEQFRQVDGSATRRFEGTGLGLTITRKLCLLMQGDIRVKSAPGEGTTFTVLIPLPVGGEESAAEHRPSRLAGGRP